MHFTSNGTALCALLSVRKGTPTDKKNQLLDLAARVEPVTGRVMEIIPGSYLLMKNGLAKLPCVARSSFAIPCHHSGS